MNPEKKNKISAIGDIHIRPGDKGKWSEFFKMASDQSDVLIICGDLTDTGHISEAEILADELKSCSIPVVAVFGNHDYENEQSDEIKNILTGRNIFILDGESIVIDNLGFAGIKGFGGGFDSHMLPIWGEKVNKLYVHEAVNETLLLDRALAHLDTSANSDLKKIVLMHYAPIKQTVIGESQEIYPFLGSSRLIEPIENRKVDVVFHGHAHYGSMEGRTPSGIRVINVAKRVLEKSGYDKPFYLFEV